MNQQEKIKERYKLIIEKMQFLEDVKKIDGFKNVQQWTCKNGTIPDKKINRFSAIIEERLTKDKEVKKINVNFAKIISDENFS